MSTTNVADNHVSSSDILCLDIACLEKLFEWLSLRDLRSLRASCKRMKLAVDFYVQKAYPSRFGIFSIYLHDVDKLKNINISSFCKLFKHIEFIDCPIVCDSGDDLANILQRAEKISIGSPSKWFENSFEDSLHLCKNLNYLHINDISNEVMEHSYPTIEHFVMMEPQEEYMPELRQFFKLNPNIQRFSIESHILHRNEDWITKSNIKLNHLDIEVNYEDEGLLIEMCNILHTLHKRGFYKRLHLYIVSSCEQTYLQPFAMLPALEKICLQRVSSDVVWPSLVRLNEFSMHNGQSHYNFETLVDKCANIERVYFESASFNDILPFIHRLTKLKQLKIYSPINDTFFNGSTIDVSALNKERAKCSDGSKITIYVKEDVFLATKRALMQTDFELIELKRAESYEWRFYFHDYQFR